MTSAQAPGGPARRAVPLTEYSPTALVFEHDAASGGFIHQYDRDLQLLCVWGGAREHDDAIRELALASFDVIAEFEVTWSPEHLVTSFERLYAEHLDGTSDKHEQVGEGPFLLLVLEDRAPLYGYRRNVSGLVELTNVHMSSLKGRARALAGGGEDPSQGVVLPARLLLGADDAGVRAAAEAQVDSLEAEVRDESVGRGTCRDHHPLPRVSPRGRERRQREEVRGVVGRDDEQRHEATLR